MRKKIILLFIITFFTYIGAVKAEQTLECHYLRTDKSEVGVSTFYSMHLIFLPNNNNLELIDATSEIYYDDSCEKFYINQSGYTEEDAKYMCESSFEYDLYFRIAKIFSLKENSSCPEFIETEGDYYFLDVTAGSGRYKLQKVQKNNILSCSYENYKLFILNSRKFLFVDGERKEKVYFDFAVDDYSECPKNLYYRELNDGQIDVTDYSDDTSPQVIKKIDRVKYSCGNITGIPKKIPELTSLIVTVVQIAIPILLVIMGSLDLFKGITAQKDDEMKKGQQMFIKRLVVAVIIFFVVIIVKLLISVVAESTSTNIVDCIDCFIDNDCGEE